MGIETMGPPAPFIELLRADFGLDIFVETGTFLGNTAVWAGRRFKRVYTIEAHRPNYDRAVREHGEAENIRFLHGHSADLLPEVLAEIRTDAMFWLDAHWMGTGSHGENGECPLLQELQHVNRSEFPHFILIDDARLFLAPPPLPHKAEHWPTISDVLGELQKKPRYTFIIDDVIASVPTRARRVAMAWAQQRSTLQWRARSRQVSGFGQRLARLIRGGWQ